MEVLVQLNAVLSIKIIKQKQGSLNPWVRQAYFPIFLCVLDYAAAHVSSQEHNCSHCVVFTSTEICGPICQGPMSCQLEALLLCLRTGDLEGAE